MTVWTVRALCRVCAKTFRRARWSSRNRCLNCGGVREVTLVRLGEAFADSQKAPHEQPSGDERRKNELLEAVNVLSFQIADWAAGVREVLERPPPVPVVQVEKGEVPEIVFPALPVPPSAEDIAAAVARIVPSPPEDHSRAVAATLAELEKQVRTLGKKVMAASIVPSGGSSGSETELRAVKDRIGEISGDTLASFLRDIETAVQALDSRTPDVAGDWDYRSGTADTVAITGRVLDIAASAPSTANATVAVDGGNTVTIPAGKNWSTEPRGNLVDPTIVFTGTDSFFVGFVA